MKWNELPTPAHILDLDILQQNLIVYQAACDAEGKQLWPMMKTHKSLEIAKMQEKFGAAGILCGTVDECRLLWENGFQNIMYAYPPADPKNIEELVRMAKDCRLILRFDGKEAALLVNQAAAAAGVTLDYTIIIDIGFHRFGVLPTEAAALAQELQQFKNLRFCGISTHPGQVYGLTDMDEVDPCAKAEQAAMRKALESLEEAGFPCEIVGSGSTPTFAGAVRGGKINMFHPGNYVFMDAIQMALGAANERDCALWVTATIISHPQEDLYICDAGAKCLGIDQGAHGCSQVTGFGLVKDHPELTVYGLSEEVGKLKAHGPCDLKVGDRIHIIPNHACSAANNAGRYFAVQGDELIKTIPIEARGNSRI